MPVDPLTSAASQAAGGLRQEDFLKLMLKQLTNQNPLEPQDNAAFVAQMAQFSALAQTQTLNESMTQSITLQSSSQAISLLGKVVKFSTDSAPENSGTVKSVAFVKGVSYLSIQVGSQLVPGITMGRIVDVAPVGNNQQ